MRINLPTGVRGRLLAVVVTSSFLSLIWVGLVHPFISVIDGLQSIATAEEERFERARVDVEAISRLEHEADKTVSLVATLSGTTLGNTAPLATSELQQKLADLAEKSDIRIEKIAVLPESRFGTWSIVSVRISVTTLWSSELQFLKLIALDERLMIVDNLQIVPAERSGQNTSPFVFCSFTVSTLWNQVGISPSRTSR